MNRSPLSMFPQFPPVHGRGGISWIELVMCVSEFSGMPEASGGFACLGRAILSAVCEACTTCAEQRFAPACSIVPPGPQKRSMHRHSCSRADRLHPTAEGLHEGGDGCCDSSWG